MRYEYECEICKKFTKRDVGKNYNKPRFCSNECRFKSKYWIKFEWDKLNKEQKVEMYRKKFEEKVVRKEGCWDWKGSISIRGYASFSCGRENITASRASWVIHFGDIPKDKCICHSCDNPRCCNPKHLFLGTLSENVKDKVDKNRQAKGCKIGFSKLTESQVREIKLMLKEEIKEKKIASQYNVTRGAIQAIKHFRTWRHIL